MGLGLGARHFLLHILQGFGAKLELAPLRGLGIGHWALGGSRIVASLCGWCGNRVDVARASLMAGCGAMMKSSPRFWSAGLASG